MLVSLASLWSTVLVFGSLNSFPPQASSPFKIQSTIDPSHHIIIAPTNKHVFKTLICCEKRGKMDINHFFIYNNNTVQRIIWTFPTLTSEKMIIVSRIRKWFKLVSNTTLGANLLEEDDMYAWTASEMYDICYDSYCDHSDDE